MVDRAASSAAAAGDAPTRPPAHRLWYAFVLVPLLFYLYTVSPTIGLGDTALLLDAIEHLKLDTHVNNHNLTILTGWLVAHLPVGDLPYRGNLASACEGALAIALFFGLVWRTAGSPLVGATTALILMVSHSMWWHSTIVECYALNAVFTGLALHALESVRADEAATAGGRAATGDDDGGGGRTAPAAVSADRALATLFAVAGLALFNHVQMGIIALGATAVLAGRLGRRLRARGSGRRRWRGAGRLLLGVTLAFLLGFLPYLVTFLEDWHAHGGLGATLRQATVGSFGSIMFKGTVSHGLRDLGYLIFMQFPSPALLLVAAGVVLLVRAWRHSTAFAGLLVMLLANAGFFMFYNTWDKFAFLLPSFVILAYAASFAVAALIRRCLTARRRLLPALAAGGLFAASIIWPGLFYGRLSSWGEQPGFWHARYNNDYTRNSHDAAAYIANPNKHRYRDVQEYANLLFERLPAAAHYIDDDSRTYYPVKYLRSHADRRRDLNLHVINSWGFSGWGLSKRAFGALLEHAYRHDRPLFLVTVDWPFSDFLAATGHDYRFVTFPLDGRRWIYRLETASELGDEPAAPYRPVVRGLHTGVRFDTPDPEVRSRLGAGEPIMAALDFELSSSVFPLRFRWLAPDGSTFFESAVFLVPLANTRAWSFLENPAPPPPGSWRVQAFSEGELLAETECTIAPAGP